MNSLGIKLQQFFIRIMPLVFGFGLFIATVLLLIPSYAVPKAFDFYDKAQHAIMFACLTVMDLLAYPQRIKRVALGLVVYGALMEVLQTTLTTTRYGDMVDWIADSVGIAVGLGVYMLTLKFFPNAINKRAL